MKKNDYILIAGVLAAVVVLSMVFWQHLTGEGTMVEVKASGKVIGRYRLAHEQTIDLNGTNTLVIRDGKADMVEADCPDKLCVKQKAISAEGETIVCLPNQIVVTVINGEKTTEDAVVK